MNSIDTRKVEFTDDTYGYHKNLSSQIQHLGIMKKILRMITDYNTSPSFDIKNIDLIAEFDNSYQIILKILIILP